jgi:hypothetical protein
MDTVNNIEYHINRTILGSILIIILIFIVPFNEEYQIIPESFKIFGNYPFQEMIYWCIIGVSFIVFFSYVLPSLVFIVKKLVQNDVF